MNRSITGNPKYLFDKAKKMSHLFLLSSLWGVLLFLSSCSDSTPDNAPQNSIHLTQAEAYFAQGQYGAATIEARNAIQSEPNNPKSHLILAHILNHLGQGSEVVKLLTKTPFPEEGEYWFELIHAYQNMGKHKTALKTLDTNRRLLEKNDPLMFNRDKANSLLSLGKLEESKASFLNALKLSPKNLDSLSGLAKCYALLNEHHDAFATLKTMEKHHPDSAQVFIFKAQLALNDGNIDEGEQLLTRALGLLPDTDIMTPEKANLLEILSDVLVRQGRASEALIYTRILADAFPGAQLIQARYEEAVQRLKEGNYDSAQEILQNVLADAPNFDRASQLLGIIKYAQGDITSADQYLSESIDPEIASTTPLQIYALTNLKLNRPTEVMNMLEESVAENKNPELIAIYGIAAINTGNFKKGLAAIEKSLALAPDNVRLHLALAQYENTKQSNPKAALERIQTAYSSNPDDAQVKWALIKQYQIMGRDDQAQAIVNEAITHGPEDYQNYLLAGDFEKSIGQFEKSVKHYQAANRLAPGDIKPLIALGRSYMAALNWPLAYEMFNEAAEINTGSKMTILGLLTSAEALNKLDSTIEKTLKLPDNKQQESKLLLTISAFYAVKNDFKTSLSYLDKVDELQIDGHSARRARAAIALRKGMLALTSGNFDNAREEAIYGLSYYADSTPLLILLAEAEIKSKNYTEANKVITQIEAIDPHTAQLLKADILVAENKTDEAIKIYRKEWDNEPGNTLGSRIHGSLVALNRRNDANDFLSRWLSAFPSSSEALTKRGTLYLAEGKINEAVVDLEHAIALQPQSPVLMNNLAWAYQSVGNPKAEELGKRAAQLAPQNPAILDTYGWILHQEGKNKEAVKYLQKAADLAPDNKEIREHLQTANSVIQGSPNVN